MTISPITHRQRLMLAAACGLVAVAVPGMSAFAQTATTGGKTEEVVVTGSRLKRSDANSDTPVTVVSAADIKRTGAQTVEQILQRLPAIGSGGIYATTNNGGEGAACTDIRQLQYQRTLVLVNGKRFSQTAGSTFSCVDLNTIPVNLIDRIEVVKDGASSVYGADAVAGVINIITKKNFTGTVFTVDGSIAGAGDDKTGKIGFTTGANFDRGNITLSGSYENRSPIEQRDRDWAHYVQLDGQSRPGNNQPYTENFPGTLTPNTTAQDGRVGSGIGIAGRLFGGANFDTGNYPNNDPGGSIPSSDGGYVPFRNSQNRFNWGDYTWLQSAMERYNIASTLNYEITDNINFYVQAYYTHVKTEQQLAPDPVTQASPSSPIYSDVVIPGFQSDYKTPNSLATAILGSGNEEDLVFWKRFVELGARHYTQNNDTFDFVAGLNGSLGWGWDYDVYANYGHSSKSEVESNIVNYQRLENEFGFVHTHDVTPYVNAGYLDSAANGAVNDAGYYDPSVCNAADGCSLITPANLTSRGLYLTQAQADYIRVNNTQQTTYTLRQWGGTLTNNDLYDLPYGPLGVVVGAEHRSEAASYTPDSLVVTNVTTNPALYATNGQFDVTEVFGEVQVPILKDLPFAKRLDMRVSGRYSNYNTFGDAYTWGVAANYAPIDDIRFRASLGTSFRQPNVFEAYGGGTVSYNTATDPCTNPAPGTNAYANCSNPTDPRGNALGVVNVNGQVPTLQFLGNPKVRPETSRTWTIGTVIAPRYLPGLSMTADYYHTRLRNTIGSEDTPTILADCYNSANFSSPSCANVLARDSLHQLTLVNSPTENLGETRTDGLDLGMSYAIPLGNGLGTITARDDFTFLFSFLQQNGLDTSFVQYAGQSLYNGQAYPRRRNNFTLDWGKDALHVGYTMRYLSGLSLDYANNENGYSPAIVNSTAEVFYHDIYASYTWRNIDATFGIDNLTDRNPPFVPDGQTNTQTNLYDVIGRLFYVKTAIKF